MDVDDDWEQCPANSSDSQLVDGAEGGNNGGLFSGIGMFNEE